MLGDPFKRVKSGDPLKIAAPAWNAAMDAARWVQEHSLDQGQGASGPGRQRIVMVQNKTGSALDVAAVVGLGDPIFAPDAGEKTETFKRQVGFEGNTPTIDTDRGRFAVLLAPLGSDDIGPAMIDGVCPVQIDVADESDEYAEIADGDSTQLASGSVGSAQILWAESGTGTKWAVVRLGTGRPAGTLFPVSLSQTGGADGTDTTQATWTYDITDALTGDSLDTGVDPTASPHLHQRPSAGSIIPANSGLAYYKPDNTLVLAFVYEVADQGSCSEGS